MPPFWSLQLLFMPDAKLLLQTFDLKEGSQKLSVVRKPDYEIHRGLEWLLIDQKLWYSDM